MFRLSPLLLLLPFWCWMSPVSLIGQQNLVPNGGFEDYRELPAHPSDFGVKNWYNPSGGKLFPYGSPDYLHADGMLQNRLPMSRYGIVHPQEGRGIAGIVAYSGAETEFREYIAIELEKPLQTGKKYHISLWVSNGERSHYMNGAIGQLGICFGKARFTQKEHEPIALEPQIVIWEILFETGWRHIEGDFVARDASRHLAIGNFFPDNQTDYRDFVRDGTRGAYYFIDNVSLTEVQEQQPEEKPDLTSVRVLEPEQLAASVVNVDARVRDSLLKHAYQDSLFYEEIPATRVVPKRVAGRRVQKQKTVEVQTKQLIINVFDARAEDGDTISISFNGEWILEEFEIRNKPTQLLLELEEGANNTLIFYAHNLGSIPPNTAVVTFEDGGHRQAIVIESDMKRCGAVTFVFKGDRKAP